MRADSSNPLLLYNSNDSSDSWETSLKTLDSTAGQGKAISYGGSTYNIYSASMLSFATDLNAYIRYSKSGSTLSILIIIPVYVSSLEFRYLAGYIDNADATTDIGSMPISSQSALWLNSTANQYFQTSPIVVNHLAAKALVATG